MQALQLLKLHSSFLSPFGLQQTQMQIDNVRERKFRNSFHCLNHIRKHYGLPTVFTGWRITTLKECIFYSSYFFVYEGIKVTLLAPEEEGGHNLDPRLAVPLSGASAGCVSWLLAFPVDSVRAGVQSQSLSRRATPTGYQMYRNLVQSRGGVAGLFMGVSPTLMRGFLVHSTRFSVFESAIWLFRILEA